MAELITLAEDYGYEQSRIGVSGDTIVDASDGEWIVANMGDDLNRYPVFIEGGDSVELVGGTITGTVPLDLSWADAYVNSTAIFVRGADDVTIRDWTIDQAWDGIRVHGDLDSTWTIENVYMSNIRDDAVENDMGLSGTIRDTFFDGVFVGLSVGDENTADQTDKLVTLDNVLIRMESFLYKGEITHMAPFKVFDDSPQLAIHDTVVALENPDHPHWHYLERAWDKLESSSNNYYLNLSDEPFPRGYPLPPEGFTVLQGQEARDYWEKVSGEWDDADAGGLAEEGPVIEVDPAPAPEPEPEPEPEPAPEPAPVPEPEPEPELTPEPEPTPEPKPEPEPEPASEAEPDQDPVLEAVNPAPSPKPTPVEPIDEAPANDPVPQEPSSPADDSPDVPSDEPDLAPVPSGADEPGDEAPLDTADPERDAEIPTMEDPLPDTEDTAVTDPHGGDSFIKKFFGFWKKLFGWGGKGRGGGEVDTETAELATRTTAVEVGYTDTSIDALMLDPFDDTEEKGLAETASDEDDEAETAPHVMFASC